MALTKTLFVRENSVKNASNSYHTCAGGIMLTRKKEKKEALQDFLFYSLIINKLPSVYFTFAMTLLMK